MSLDETEGTDTSQRPSVEQSVVPSTPNSADSTCAPVAAGGDRKKPAKGRSLQSTIIETLLIIAAAFAIAMLVQTFMFRVTGILQKSMEPTLYAGDRVIVNCLAYNFGEPQRGDIVVLRDPEDDKKDIIKRIIAVGGDTLEATDGVLYINDEVVDEPYVVNEDVMRGVPEITVPEGYVFVMGDNRPNSKDSRAFGAVAEEAIIGKVVCIMWPASHWRIL